VLGTAGLIAVFIGVPNAIAANLHVRRAEGLRRGRKVVARWSVSPAAWARFVKLDGEDTREGRLWPNQLAASPEPASKAVEVIVGENAILVGDDSHLLFDGGRGARVEVIPGDPLRLNVITVVDEPVGPETEASYRLPVGVGCSAEVGAVRAYFARAEPQAGEARGQPKRTPPVYFNPSSARVWATRALAWPWPRPCSAFSMATSSEWRAG
jgi:hypothetical protein